MKIIHIAISEKFLPPFISMVNKHFNNQDHTYAFITSEKYEFGLEKAENIRFFHTDDDFAVLTTLCEQADKIILHGLWRYKINQMLVANPSWFKKCCWVMWGADFYYPDNYDYYHKEVIKQVGFLVSGVPGDIDLVRQQYSASGKFIESMAYTMFPECTCEPFDGKTHRKPTILIGNSAAESNFHREAIDLLRPYKDLIGHVYIPLSYAGNKTYIKDVINHSTAIFGDNCTNLTDYLPLNAYIDLLGDIDIAIFNQNRQQALSNILMLLMFGKKVYLRPSVTTYQEFIKKGFHIFSTQEINLSPLTEKQINKNHQLMEKYYSENALVKQLSIIFSS